MTTTQYLSQEKKGELEQELIDLKLTKIPEIAQRIDEAKQMGDLSENAEYHDARDQMAWAQSRVLELEAILHNAEVITTTGSGDGVVDLGRTVVVKVNGKEKEYTIVGAQEADPLSGKISNESPLGEAFMGKKKGDAVVVEVPAGVQEYKIIAVK
ncbi:MAG: Transcription elongation factor GreA [Candidatus Magasanikbacteria bacterium GW2011_GWD2_43_18]|uniref:Transcription elongation factor GreA n=1 Tax=Candidatus Magasanikbacteria bacterium GW2011_GWE2_42_7 TaxID=1619052 RepID=A0A0G1DQC6_9BACT|nr:MAG: Transcription elongation factor GreA [Candidatus Magasanikbacteria bacterium GW2011_GWC2_42_27]KKS73026.1 MAG: Transcription elongation factor GreA [Candidatus Magasanikbacteria bacterium GW2011_GWE2_42_7]KKT03988.1 MAG: Transcription elongation factor GreA [Candidatus Magasanikbacteria bacterium GW2011_GWD2_43_18]KKT26006.1 MAG: Transcription elongation factor GreA [Candidatus Magasanikbacteria bacterium GW2011_GWA2_43_9]HBB37710.1 transcription elongation factor GreA [Candidatus Magas